MRIGAFLLGPGFPGQDHAAVLDTTVAAAVAAEQAGFDDVWVAEHHFMTYGLVPSAVTLAGYLLGRLLPPGAGEIALFTGSLSYRGHEEREVDAEHVFDDAMLRRDVRTGEPPLAKIALQQLVHAPINLGTLRCGGAQYF
jgi:hypothetical protein